MRLVGPQLNQVECLALGNSSAPEDREMKELKLIVWNS